MIDHEDLVKGLREFLVPAQIAEHHLHVDIVTHRDHVEVHQRADGILREGQHLAHLAAVALVELRHHRRDGILGQAGHQPGDLVRLEVGGSVDDVLLALGLQPERRRTATEQRPTPIGNAKIVLDSLPWQAVPVEQVITATNLDLGTVMLLLEQLEIDGWVTQRSGWIERIARGGAQ